MIKSTTTPAPVQPVNRVTTFLDAFFATDPSLSEINEMALALIQRADQIRHEAERQRLHVVWDATVGEFRRAAAMESAALELQRVVVEGASFLVVPAWAIEADVHCGVVA